MEKYSLQTENNLPSSRMDLQFLHTHTRTRARAHAHAHALVKAGCISLRIAPLLKDTLCNEQHCYVS
jgi:hypothetical protein